MKKAFKIAAVFLALFSTFSCAISKAIYLGPNDYSLRNVSSAEYPSSENINGIFPEAVYIKTKTQTFNTYHYYVINDGLIWYKSIDPNVEPKEWTLFMKTGLPHAKKLGFLRPTAITEISADADELVALSVDGYLYSYCFDRTMALRSRSWLDKQGWPVSDYFYFDQRTANNRSWALGKRNSHVLYYEDIFGNQHHNGSMEISTFYVLLEDGQEICYGDPGLPSDFSRNFIGPERGTFIAKSLSASASTMFVINEAGEMYTRLVDYDTIGCDPMFFKYTYVPYESDLSGTQYFSNLNEWGLPAEDWRPQPRIPLTGNAVITRHITILQNGQGNSARELRIAGLDKEGKTGYWSKPIFADSWEFITAPLYFTEDSIITTAESNYVNAQGERGQSLDKNYTGYQWNNNEKESGWEYQIHNFNILEGDCEFRITWQGETCTLKLHPLDMWTYLKRDYLPGRTGSPKIFLVTLEVPDNALESLSATFASQLNEKFIKNNKKLFHYTIAASDKFIIMRDTDNTSSVLFLTDGTISDHYSELHVGHYVENYTEVKRYYSPELTIANNIAVTLEDLNEKISLNKQFLNELKYQIRVLRWSGLTAFKFNAGYLPAHYIARMTPLRFVDVPKIRTVTSYSDKLILANSAYINTTANTRIWLYEKIVAMVETRLLCYNDMVKEYSKLPSDIFLPSWYSDDISDYWDIAGLPRTISGAFNYQETANRNIQLPAVLSFVPTQSGQNISGWFFTINENSNFIFFVEPHNIAKTIYSRKGRSPQERRLELSCTLHINDNASSPIEQNIIEHSLMPHIREKSNTINVNIRFDGRTFEIRENSAGANRLPIFCGVF